MIRTSFSILLLTAALSWTLSAQPEWRYGGALGANFNYYGGSVQALNAGLTAPNAFTKGSGVGLFLAPMVEYRPSGVFGGMLAFGFDSRRGSFEDVAGTAGGTATLSTSLSYLSLEPSLRIAPFAAPVYFFAGPRVGFNIAKSFSYADGSQPASDGEWSGLRGAALGVQAGAGYEFALTDKSASTQIGLSPFVAFHFGQGPRSEETWSLSTVRFGMALMFGGTGAAGGADEDRAGAAGFTVRAPRIIPSERRVNETFPMRNFVFFDAGSAAVPARYIQLTPDRAGTFREEQLLEPQPKDLTGRSRRQMATYSNVLNVLGDRMRRIPAATVTLVGSADEGDGRACAESVKKYLVDVFGIDAQRIRTEGREKPAIPSYQPGGTREVELVKPEDRRVEIVSSTVQLLDPVQIVSLQEDPLDSDVLLTVPGAEEKYASWSVEVTDASGLTKRYGPFTASQERIPGRDILGSRMEGEYTIAMIGETRSGAPVRTETKTRLVRSDEPAEDLGLRFSILFEFDQSKTVATYERFLTQTVAPLIPEGASVVIHGHTDVVGEESHNLKLSKDRSAETQTVLQRALTKAGKRRVKFDTYGFGEDVRRAPFDNRLPEERFYNRTVIIDIIPE